MIDSEFLDPNESSIVQHASSILLRRRWNTAKGRRLQHHSPGTWNHLRRISNACMNGSRTVGTDASLFKRACNVGTQQKSFRFVVLRGLLGAVALPP
mmetsp:Transcript_41791/g.61841  ORF Transcript_41791/g.61841 Transcript_41791/m.61841 type:complete len:97 (-) Transcript_41791:155-445(-)